MFTPPNLLHATPNPLYATPNLFHAILNTIENGQRYLRSGHQSAKADFYLILLDHPLMNN